MALARELQRRGVRPVLLERGRVGETWARQYQGRRLRAYAERFALDVREGVTLQRAAPTDRGAPSGWHLDTDRGPWSTERLVMATGIWSAPVEPPLPGREAFAGRTLHVSAYRGPAALAGARVLAVGLGNSGKDVAWAAAEVGASATVAVRDGSLFVPYPNALTQHAGALLRRLPSRLADTLLRRLRREPVELGLRWPTVPPTEAYPVVGLEVLDALRAGDRGAGPVSGRVPVPHARELAAALAPRRTADGPPHPARHGCGVGGTDAYGARGAAAATLMRPAPEVATVETALVWPGRRRAGRRGRP